MARNKRTRQSDQRPLRFTDIQHRLSEGVQYLIQLYYVFKENKEPFIPVMKGFLKRVKEEDFEYKGKAESSTKELVRGFGIPKGDYFRSKRHLIHFDDSQQSHFVDIMDLLHESIMEHTVYHFFPVKWAYKTETFLADAEPKLHPTDTPDEVTEPGFNVNKSIPEKLIHDQAVKTLRKQQPQTQEYPLSRKDRKQVDGSKKRVKIISFPYRVYEVSPRTGFGRALLQTESTIDLLQLSFSDHDSWRNRGRNYYEVPSINSYGMSYFLRIVRSLLVDYHIVFGNFERIKVCEYNQCNKLFFEKRAGEKRFCSDACRSKFSDEPKEKLSCRKRHNQWISNKTLAPYRLVKGECEKCDLWHPEGGRLRGGKCQILRKNNKEAFKMIEKS